MNEAVVTYPGLNRIISFNYTRGHGISPGFISVTCVPQEEWPDRQGTVRLQYGDFSLNLRNCVVDNSTFTFDATGHLWHLMLMDRRWKWRYGSIDGRYNVRLPNGPVDKLDPRTEKTPRELIDLLLKQMGEVNYAVGTLPEKLRPTIMWDHSNPAQELANLCDQFGMAICLRDDDSVAIMPKGWGDFGATSRTELSNESLIADSGTTDPPELPSKVKFVCGASRYQGDFLLECVNDDIDGLVKPIDELSYSPFDDVGVAWNTADIINFNNIALFNPGDPKGMKWNSYVSPRELCRSGIYKKYRVLTRDAYGIYFLIEGHKKPIEDPRLILPLSSELVEPTFDPETGWYRPMPCIVWGVFAFGGGLRNSYDPTGLGNDEGPPTVRVPMIYQARDPVTGALIPKQDATVIPPEKYSVDPDTGIFTFADRIYRIGQASSLLSRKRRTAMLWARVTVNILDKDTLCPLREEVEFPINDIAGFEGVEDLGTDVLIIRDDDIFLRVIPQYDKDNPHISLNAPTDNKDFIKDYARERVTAEMRKYQTLGPRAVTYAGWVVCDSAGDVMQVNYQLTESGAITKISLNGEVAVLTMTYGERRFYEKIRNEKLDKAMDDYNRMAFEKGYPFSRLTNLTRTGR